LAGLGIAAVGFAGKFMVRRLPQMTKTMEEAVKNLPRFDAEYLATSKYYKGGFDQKVYFLAFPSLPGQFILIVLRFFPDEQTRSFPYSWRLPISFQIEGD
jgi:hypothetical protein